MAFAKVIKYEGDNKTFIWKYPSTTFNTGSQLIVRESQQAVFIANGEILDIFEAGKHTLETGNLPGIKRILALATGGRVQFLAELYFINLTEQMAIRWGTDSKVQYMDPEYGFPLEIGACGEMSLAVSNSQKLLVKLVGTEKNLSQEQLTKAFRAILMTRIKSIIPDVLRENAINVFSIDQNLGLISEKIQERVSEDFDTYGIALKQFMVTTVLKPDEDRNYIKFKELHYRKYTEVAEAKLQQELSIIEEQTKAQKVVIGAEAMAQKRALEGYTYQQEKGFEVAKEIAGNQAVGELNNIGVGLGMMAGVGGTIGQQMGVITSDVMQSMNITGAAVTGTSIKARFCMQCGNELADEAIFCPMCGKKRG